MRRILILLIIVMSTNIQTSAQAQAQRFKFSPHKDEMTDRDISYVSAMSKDAETLLSFKCDNNRFYVAFTWKPILLPSNNFLHFEYRFPPSSSIENRGILSDFHASFLEGRTAQKFTIQAINYPIVIIRTSDHDGNSVDGEFDLDGLQEELQKLHCYSAH